jgi:hypothetical protein
MGGVLVAPGMPRTSIVDRHPARGRQPSLQDGVLLGMEGVLVRGEQGDDLAFGDADAQAGQLDPPALDRDLPLDVLHQDVAHHARPGPKWPATSGGSGAMISPPSGVSQRSRR